MNFKNVEKRTIAILVIVTAATSSVVLLMCHFKALEDPLRHLHRRSEMPFGSIEEGEGDESTKLNFSTREKRMGERVIRLNLPVRRLHPGIHVGRAMEPPLCPPPPVTRSLGICHLQKCSSHHECPQGHACCFNGCIHACTEPLDQPAAFDWIEDTSKILPILGMDFEAESPAPFFPVPVPQQPSTYEAAEGGEELVHLPGGCFISATKYQKLQEFMKAPSIKNCRCNEGEVVCDIRTEKI